MRGTVTFSEIWDRVLESVREAAPDLGGIQEIWALRDLSGRVSLVVTPQEERGPFLQLAEVLHRGLGAHAYPPEETLLVLEAEEREEMRADAIPVEEGGIRIYLVDPEITGRRWATVSGPPGPPRFVFFGLKGGLGRSTTAAVLAAHLARKGHRVLVMDFDLESPTLSSMLTSDEHPDFGIVEWLVEDLVDQGDIVLASMSSQPRWSQDLGIDVIVVPAYGSQRREYIPQLGRAYLDKFPKRLGEPQEKWIERIQRLVQQLEERTQPDVVLLDSRSGIHDIAAALITGLRAEVLLFAVDSEPTWSGYRILFDHWVMQGVVRQIRERLSVVAALVPPVGQEAYLERFRENAYRLFADFLYDETPPEVGDWFSYDVADEEAPHQPLPIYWERGLLAWESLRSLDTEAVQSAYREFLERFDQRLSP